jgi:hypothetical protein
LLPSLGLAAGSCERLVATASPDAPPYAWRDPADPRALVGASVELLGTIAEQLDVKVDVLYSGSRAQALEEVRSGRMDILADAALTEADLQYLDYVYPPLASVKAPVPSSDAGLADQGQSREATAGHLSVHLAIGQDSACNDGWLRGQLAKKMTELTASGRVQAILQRNVERWSLQQQAATGAVKP